MKRALIVIAKRPSPGETKTRLSPPFSPEESASLYECFLLDTLDVAREVPNVTRLIAFTPDHEADYFKQLAMDFGLIRQVGNSLGERLDNALTQCLSGGFDQAVIMDSDSPTLPPAYVSSSFDLLDDSDLVLGPCDDGGYYLIGLKRSQPHLLRNVRMSTPRVLKDTLALAERDGLSAALLPVWYDVDTIDDLVRLKAELSATGHDLALHTRNLLHQLETRET